MKKFWWIIALQILSIVLAMAAIVVFFPYLSHIFPWLLKIGVNAVIVVGTIMAFSGMALRYGVTYWFYVRIAKRQGVSVGDIIYALYEWGWPMAQVQFSKHFKADFEEMKRIKDQMEAERKEFWGE